jgi:hypothetical protein
LGEGGAGSGGVLGRYVAVLPEPTELWALQQEFSDEPGEHREIRISGGQGAQTADEGAGLLISQGTTVDV